MYYIKNNSFLDEPIIYIYIYIYIYIANNEYNI